MEDDKTLQFRQKQALSSLYSLVPKTFEFKGGYQPQLDKLAIIVVSSWLSDAVWNEQDKTNRISNIYGEIVVINKVSGNVVKVEPIKTFADNQSHSKIYQEPEIIKDEISKLYQQGYRDFLYIAKAPYSKLIGDDGIGTVSTYSYSNKNVKFNNLAYLTEIRSALYGK